MKLAVALIVAATLTAYVMASPKGTSQDTWADTEYTTNMWNIISSGNVEELKSLLEASPEMASVRSMDGRGPLWWAHEYQQAAMVQLLLDAGANPNERDGDGKRPLEIVDVGPTEYMRERMESGEFNVNSESPAKDYHGEDFEDFD